MNINFSKLTAAGNDFILIDNREYVVSESDYQNLAKKLCDRKYSIGSDGLILLEKSESCDFKMRYFNSDGSHASMCGNGGRSIAKFAREIGAAKEKMSFETDAGLINAEILNDERVKLDLYDPKDLKMGLKTNVFGEEIEIDFIDTGVPHAVIFTGDIEKVDVVKYGRAVRNNAVFAPAGTNVNFVQALKDNTILVRTYERGVEGETLACGTGITASAIIAVLKGLAKSPVNIVARGGDILNVSFDYDTKMEDDMRKMIRKLEEVDFSVEREKIKTNIIITNVVLEGPAIIVFKGTVTI